MVMVPDCTDKWETVIAVTAISRMTCGSKWKGTQGDIELELSRSCMRRGVAFAGFPDPPAQSLISCRDADRWTHAASRELLRQYPELDGPNVS
jgi:hypothetical protein